MLQQQHKAYDCLEVSPQGIVTHRAYWVNDPPRTVRVSQWEDFKAEAHRVTDRIRATGILGLLTRESQQGTVPAVSGRSWRST